VMLLVLPQTALGVTRPPPAAAIGRRCRSPHSRSRQPSSRAVVPLVYLHRPAVRTSDHDAAAPLTGLVAENHRRSHRLDSGV